MMRTVPYMVFRYRFSSNEYLERPDSTGYLFYDPTVKRLYELPHPKSSAESTEQEAHPIRYLRGATLLEQNIQLNSHYDFTHSKTIRKLLSDKYPGPLKLQSTGINLVINHENGKIIDHFTRGAWTESDDAVRFWDWKCLKRADIRRVCRQIPPRRYYWRHEHRGFRTTDETDLTEPLFRSMLPNFHHRKQTYGFREIFFTGDLYALRHQKVGFIISETELKTDGRSKTGTITRWLWANEQDNRVTKFGPFQVDITTGKPNICILDDEQQHSPQQLYESISDIIYNTVHG